MWVVCVEGCGGACMNLSIGQPASLENDMSIMAGMDPMLTTPTFRNVLVFLGIACFGGKTLTPVPDPTLFSFLVSKRVVRAFDVCFWRSARVSLRRRTTDFGSAQHRECPCLAPHVHAQIPIQTRTQPINAHHPPGSKAHVAVPVSSATLAPATAPAGTPSPPSAMACCTAPTQDARVMPVVCVCWRRWWVVGLCLYLQRGRESESCTLSFTSIHIHTRHTIYVSVIKAPKTHPTP